jgi:tRNA A-37 threonylcarbamoyl transferase component Bud32
MHNAGVLHQDLHPANLLVRLGVDDEPLLFLIDLHAVRLTEPLDWTTGRDNLVMLNRWFALRVSRADRLRFWLSYAQARDQACMRRWSGSVLETVSRRAGIERALLPLADQLEQRTWPSNLRFWKHRDRRCLVSNKYYRRVHSGVADGFSVTDLDAAALKPFLDNPDGPFERAGVKLLKDSRSSTVAELEVLLGGKRTPVIYKRFRVTAWSDPWVSLARRSGALRSWVFGHGLRERCLPTPRPLAVLHRRRHGLQGEGYLLTEKLENAVDLHGWLATLETLPPSARLGPIRELIDQCARLIRELHRRRLTHRDLKAANLLVTGDTSQRPQLWFIDLVGVRLQRRLPRARRVQNLARLNASFHASNALTRTDRLRFLRIYLQWALRGRRGWKRTWREIEEATTAKVARNRRVGRPLA